MKKNFTFGTLSEFASVVETCKATNSDGVTLPLKEALTKAVELFQRVDRMGKKIMLVGNGGSAAIASHIAIDLWKNGGVRSTAFNDASLLTCVANDFSYEEVFSKSIGMFGDTGDILIAISSSGKSKNILNAVDAASKLDCPMITFSGFKSDNPLRARGGLNFYLASESYGVVEVGHLLLIHSIADEMIQQKMASQSGHQAFRTESKSATTYPKRSAR